jgi:xylose isomerase
MKITLFKTIIATIAVSFMFACTKQADYSQDIANLKSDLTTLRKTSDSLANALSQTNSTLLQNAANMTAFQK